MQPVIALYDACVLYPAPLRDLLMWLALADLFRTKWIAGDHCFPAATTGRNLIVAYQPGQSAA